MSSSLELENYDAIVRQVRALGPEARAAARDALYQGAQIIAADARPRIPRSRKPRTGGWRTGQHLADVLMAERITWTTKPFSGVTTPGGVARGPFFYIRFLEYGTRKGISARHYVGNAAAARETAVREAVASALRSKLGL